MYSKVRRSVFMGFVGAFLFVFSPFVMSVSADDEPEKLPEPNELDGSDSPSLAGDPGNGHDETPGEWIEGDTPSNLKDDAPILLFVPGLNNVAQVFYEDNDMYETAFDAGYQTAFIQLHDAGGESADMWDNGELLAEKIDEISDHFDGKPITIVAYSKGGVDTQTALAHYGAWDKVDNVITLSSPHHGSQLADLAYSSWAGWLADLLGSQGDGTYSMQTGEMEEFRSEIEEKEHANTNDYYTLGGTGWSSGSASIKTGGLYLSQYGSNDGVVTAESSILPGGVEIEVGDWNHTTIRTGDTFPVFEDYLTTDESSNQAYDVDDVVMNEPSADQLVRGGPLAEDDDNTVTIPVEEDVDDISLNLMTADVPKQISLVDPSGKSENVDMETVQSEEGYFPGAYHTVINKKAPEAGEWEIELSTEKDSAYLVTVDYETRQKVKLHQKEGNDTLDWKDSKHLDYQLEMDSNQVEASSLEAVYRITDTQNPEETKTLFTDGKNDLSQSLSFDDTDTVYNLTIDVSGETTSGHPFQRTIIDSVYVGE